VRPLSPNQPIGADDGSKASSPSAIDGGITYLLEQVATAHGFPASSESASFTLTNGRSNRRFLHFSEFSLHTIAGPEVKTHRFALGVSQPTLRLILRALPRLC
jgi:hypothetical protein